MGLIKLIDKHTAQPGTRKMVEKAVKSELGDHQNHIRLLAVQGLKTRLAHLDRLGKVMLEIEQRLLAKALSKDDLVRNYCLLLLNMSTTVSHIKDLASVLKTEPGTKVPDQVKKRAMAICEALAALAE